MEQAVEVSLLPESRWFYAVSDEKPPTAEICRESYSLPLTVYNALVDSVERRMYGDVAKIIKERYPSTHVNNWLADDIVAYLEWLVIKPQKRDING